MEEMQLAYTAGFFDGEGCIGIYFYRDSGCKRGGRFRLSAALVQKERLGLFEKLEREFGGNLYERGYRDIWRWKVWGHDAAKFLKAIVPYLQKKKAEAQIAIEFQNHQHNHGRAGLSNIDFAYQGACARALKDLKRGERIAYPLFPYEQLHLPIDE